MDTFQVSLVTAQKMRDGGGGEGGKGGLVSG